MKKKSFIYPVIFMVLITSVFTFILAFANYKTEDVIAFNEENKVREKLLYTFDIALDSKEPEDIEKAYNDYISEIEVDDKKVYIAKKDNEVLGYGFVIDGNALWGSVKGFAAISHDLDTLLGIDFVSHSETPGLGGRIDEAWFKEQFRGIELDTSKDEFIVYRPSSGGNVDAISGATLTSDSVRKFLNEDINKFLNLAKEVDLNE